MLETAMKIVPKRTGCCNVDLLSTAILRGARFMKLYGDASHAFECWISLVP